MSNFLSKVGHGLLKPIDQLARSDRVGSAVRVTAGTATSFIPGIGVAEAIHNRQGIKGVWRGVLSVVPGGKIGLLAYDAKRLRDRTRSATIRYRRIKKQALLDAGAVEGRIKVLNGYTSTTPLVDSLIPPADINFRDYRNVAGIHAQIESALPGPDTTSEPAPGHDDERLEAPDPSERGAGGDAAEGTRTSLAGVGKGMVAFLVIGGLVAALYAARRAN